MHEKIVIWNACLRAPYPACPSVLYWYSFVHVLISHVTYESAPLSLDVLVSLINWLGPPPRAPASCNLDPVLSRYPVPRPWSCLAICICIYIVGSRHFACSSPTHWMCSRHLSDREDLALVWLPFNQFLYLEYPTWFILHMYFKWTMHPVLWQFSL